MSTGQNQLTKAGIYRSLLLPVQHGLIFSVLLKVYRSYDQHQRQVLVASRYVRPIRRLFVRICDAAD